MTSWHQTLLGQWLGNYIWKPMCMASLPHLHVDEIHLADFWKHILGGM